MRKTLIGLSPLLLLGATAAHAQTDTPPAPPPGPMARGAMGVQPDAQGNITRAAALAAADRRFAAMDANHDGTVSSEEMQAYRAERRAEWQRRHPEGDRPAPQPVTAEAFRARAAAMFDRLDTNHDGRIDAAERAAAPRFGHRRGPHPGQDRGDGMAPAAQPAAQDD